MTANQTWNNVLKWPLFTLQPCEELLHKAAAPDLHAGTEQLAAAISERAAAAGLIVTERASSVLPPLAHQSASGTTRCLSTEKSTPSSNPQGSGGDSAPVTCGLKPFPPLIWCLRIRLCYPPVAPAVRPAARGCRNISQKAWRSAEGGRHEAPEPHQSAAPSVSFARQPAGFLEIWRHPVAAEATYRFSLIFFLSSYFFPLPPLSVLQWQWCCFWSGSLLLWITPPMTTKLQVNNVE